MLAFNSMNLTLQYKDTLVLSHLSRVTGKAWDVLEGEVCRDRIAAP